MKLTKALSLILTLAMLLGTLAIGVTAAVGPEDIILYPDLHQTGTAGLNGYQAITDENRPALPATVYTMTEFVNSGKTVPAFVSAVENRNFTISSAEEMIMFSEKVNAGEPFYMAKIFLTQDIVFADGQTMAPIGNYVGNSNNNPNIFFRGDFNGRGFAIKNLHMTSNADGYVNVALFGCIRGAAIQNLVIDSSCSFTYTGSSKDARVASVAAYALTLGEDGFGATTDTQFNPEGTQKYAVGSYMQYSVKKVDGKDVTNYDDPAVARLPVSYLIKNVKNNASVSSTTSVAGGILAVASGATSHFGLVMQCTQSASVAGGTYAGGILGAVLARGVRVIECQVKSNTNATVKIAGDVVDARANNVGGSLDFGNFGDFAAAELRDTTEGFDYDVRGYSFKNVKRVNTASMPRISAYAANSSAKEFKVINAEDMLAIATLVNGGNNLHGKTIYLANDIDWAADENKNVTMVTIGGDGASANHEAYRGTKAFSGVFDGQGYVIDNLKMSFTTNFGGLFGNVRNATIKNMVLGYGCEFYSTGKWVAPIAMLTVYGGENVEVVNCFNASTVTKPDRNVASGMVAFVSGYTNAAYGKVLYCTNAGKITAGWTIGAMIGYAVRPVFVNYCVNTGDLEATAGKGDEVGAMVGAAHGGGQFINNLTTTLPKYLKTAKPFDNFFGTRNGSPWVQTGNISEDTTNPEYQKIFADWTAPIHYAGYQTQTVDGKVTAVRILATVNSLDAANVGFMLSAVAEEAGVYTYTTDCVYGSVLARENGVNYSVQAETLGGKYLVAVTIIGIPADGVTIRVIPFADEASGSLVEIELN